MLRKTDYQRALAVLILHLLTALFLKEIIDLDIRADVERNTWDWFWQTLPMSALKSDFFASLINLHAQPPLFNFIGGVFIKCFEPLHLEALHYFHIALGGLVAAMTYINCLAFSHRRTLSLITAVVLALHPALFLYQAYALYTLLAAFLVSCIIFTLALYQHRRNHLYLYFFIASLNLLILTRSVFHIVLLVPALLLVTILSPNSKRVLVISLIISLPAIAWYGKNSIKFGFFGSSSWSGMGLWKITMQTYNSDEMQQWIQKGIVDKCVADHYPFTPPMAYASCGFNRKAQHPVLSENDYNNINMIDISRLYGNNAIRLIKKDPIHYLKNCIYAFIRFTRPSSQFKHLGSNREKIKPLEYLYAHVFQGQWIVEKLKGIPFGFFLFIYLPAGMLFFLVRLFLKNKFYKREWIDALQSRPALMFAALMMLYTVLVGSMFEYGENERFKFLIEMLIWPFLLSLPTFRSFEQFINRKK